MAEKIVLIDGHSILNRAFYGMPDLTNSAGLHTGAIYGFLNILFRILDEEKADYLTVAFDVHAPTFRHEVYSEYKGTRSAMPDELREQVPLMKKVLTSMGIRICEKAGLEADDILGTLAKKAQSEGMEVCLVSGDRDLLQIADEHIQIRIPKTIKGQTTLENYYAGDVLEKMQVTPEEFIQVKALQGDTSDNVPGVPGVGPKTATQLIVRYKTVENVYAHLDEITKKALHENLANNRDKALLSLFLVTIRTDCDIDLDRQEARIGNFYTRQAYELFTELGFKNYLRRFDSSVTASATKADRDSFTYSVMRSRLDADAFLSGFRSRAAEEFVGVYLLFDRKPLSMPDRLTGAAFSTSEGTVFIPVSDPEEDEGTFVSEGPEGQLSFADALSAAVEDARTKVKEERVTTAYLTKWLGKIRRAVKAAVSEAAGAAVFGLKNQFPFWDISADEFKDGIRLDGMFDLLIGAYLNNPLKNDYEPEDVASEYLGDTIQGRKQFLDKKTCLQKMEESFEETALFCARTADALRRAAAKVQDKLREQEMLSLYRTMELPLSYILYDMERIGIRVMPEHLRSYGEKLTGRIEELEKSIHELAGEEFNIASPKQLGVILFEKLELPGAKKTKSGYSTAAEVLEKLAPDYQIVRDILEYRALTKLKSTYADGLYAFIADDSRIHTTFNQTITATGRISSTDPNLQNIPMRTDLGREIRKVFVPAGDWTFTDADYSQIELRILASMSGDDGLIEAFHNHMDIHRSTASKVFHTPFDQVSDLQRRNAKAVNFGIVYGISSFGLSQDLSISVKEANGYIEEYFRTYPGIKAFLDRLVSDAKKNGYSVTLFGRRRPIPELANSNFMQRQFGERVAMNAPIQGTGADIMKLAMIRVWEMLHRQGLRSELILQIHDELLIETAPGEEEAVEQILKEGMMGAAGEDRMKVLLEVECHSGRDWYEAK